MSTVLIVDDENDILEIIAEYAKQMGYNTVLARSGTEALEALKKNDINLIVLDIMLPDFNGYEIADRVRKEKRVPIIMLSAKSEEEDKLKGFELGIVDYVTKPFSPKELMARIKVNLSKTLEGNARDKYTFEGVTIDRTAKKVFVDKREIELTIKEYELLNFLTQNKNIFFSREQILDKVWGMDFFGTDRTVDTHIKSLRKKIGKYRGHIVTLRGAGYRFEE